jgi:hypothetical protein
VTIGLTREVASVCGDGGEAQPTSTESRTMGSMAFIVMVLALLSAKRSMWLNIYIKRQTCRLSQFTIVSVNRCFSLVQPHYVAFLGRTVETGKHDHGEIFSQSEI